MSLDSYVENAWLKKEATSLQEITDQLGIVARCMKDASVEGNQPQSARPQHLPFSDLVAPYNVASHRG